MLPDATDTPAPQPSEMTFFLLAIAAGAGAANLYYAQPLIALIAPDVGLDQTMASLVVTLGQIGYILGLVFLVPLGDIIENRRLISLILLLAALGLGIAAASHAAVPFLLATLLFGFGSVVAQIAVPFASHLAAPEQRGRRIGAVVSGLTGGILLARPIASMLAHWFGWRAVFLCALVAMLALAAGLRLALPARRPAHRSSYLSLVRSLWPLLRDTPLLRRRAIYQAAMFGCFTLFWTAVPLLLSAAPFNFDQRGIALFALAGASSVFISPFAGRIADRGLARPATGAAIALAIVGFLVTWAGAATGSVVVLGIGAIVLDGAVTANLVFGQRSLFMLSAETRSRLNALYIAFFFGGGAFGSAIASAVYEYGGWPHVVLAGVLGLAAVLLYFLVADLHLGRRESAPR